MEKLIAMCGLLCNECGAFQATQDNDDAKRIQTAKEWSKRFGVQIEPSTISCTGCTSESGVPFSYCQVCDIRACGMEKGVKSCGHCQDYACDMLMDFLERAPECRTTLESIRKNI